MRGFLDGCLRILGLVHKDHKFVAAQSSDHVVLPKFRLQKLHKINQDLIADHVSARIVDFLKVINIQQE